MLGALMAYFMAAGALGLMDSPFPGAAAFSPLTGFLGLFTTHEGSLPRLPTVFGHSVPWLALSLLLWASFGFWIVLMLLRNLKRDYEEIRLLSRWQAIGCAAFLNFVIYALFSPARAGGVEFQGFGWNDGWREWRHSVRHGNCHIDYSGTAASMVAKADHGRCNHVLRGRPGLAWLALSAATAYALMVWGALAWDHALPVDTASLERAAIQLAIVLVFITRDVLFLQWWKLTRMSRPVLKGLLYLSLYYAAAVVLTALFSQQSDDAAVHVLNLLTPVGVANPDVHGVHFSVSLYLGVALQVGLIATLITAIGGRVNRTLRVVAAGD
jgi:hypothetical protein